MHDARGVVLPGRSPQHAPSALGDGPPEPCFSQVGNEAQVSGVLVARYSSRGSMKRRQIDMPETLSEGFPKMDIPHV